MRMPRFVPVLISLSGVFVFCSVATAQTAPAMSMPAASSTAPNPANVNGSTTFQASNGTIVTVKSWQPSHKQVGPAPAFASLDADGNGSINISEAASYPLLANDFNYADGSHNHAVSQSEYAHWVSQP